MQLATFSLKLYRQLYRLDFFPIFQRMMHASNPEEPAGQAGSPALAPYYSDGALQGFFSTTSGTEVLLQSGLMSFRVSALAATIMKVKKCCG
jgi:hypothetical protein